MDETDSVQPDISQIRWLLEDEPMSSSVPITQLLLLQLVCLLLCTWSHSLHNLILPLTHSGFWLPPDMARVCDISMGDFNPSFFACVFQLISKCCKRENRETKGWFGRGWSKVVDYFLAGSQCKWIVCANRPVKINISDSQLNGRAKNNKNEIRLGFGNFNM